MAKKPGYGGLPEGFDSYDASKIVIMPVPYDETTTWMKGADMGPNAIIEASANMYLYDIETDSEVYRQGIFTDAPVTEKISPEFMIDAVRSRASRHLAAGKFLVTVGGEHSISLGAVQAHAERYVGLSVLQLDAHADLQDEFNGSRFNHACVMARVREVCPVVQVGIRSMDAPEKASADTQRLFLAEDIQGRRDWMEKAVSLLTDQVYVTVDVDCFDPSVMPATGTPEPGGLSWYEVTALLRMAAERKKIIGFDLVELCPNPYSKHCDFLAAKLIYKMLGYAFRAKA
jgi:agmatinase